jgi:MFS family permease
MNEKRIFGNGVVFAGVPIGGLLFSPFWTFLFDKFSWKGACLVQAGISLQTLWISLLIIECPASPIDKERKPFDWSLLTSGPIMMFAFSQSLYFCSYSSILLLVPYMMGKGFSPIDSALAVTLWVENMQIK